MLYNAEGPFLYNSPRMRWVSGAYGAEFSLGVVSAIETLAQKEEGKELSKLRKKVALPIEKR